MTQAPTASLTLTPAGGKDFASSVIYQVYPKSFYSAAPDTSAIESAPTAQSPIVPWCRKTRRPSWFVH